MGSENEEKRQHTMESDSSMSEQSKVCDHTVVEKYRTKHGEMIFRIMDLIDTAEKKSQDLDEIVSIKNIGTLFEDAPKESTEPPLRLQCIVCNEPILGGAFSVFCGTCLVADVDMMSIEALYF